MKKLFAMMIAGMMVFSLAGCGEKAVAVVDDAKVVEKADEEIEAEEAEAEEEIVEVEEEELVEEVVEEPKEEDISVFAVSEEHAKANGGVFLKRNGKLYELNKMIRPQPGVTYNVGEYVKMTGIVAGKVVTCIQFYSNEKRRSNGHREGYTIGDVPIIAIESTDEFIGYSAEGSSTVPKLFVGNVIEMGYTISIDYNAYEKFEVLDSQGNIVPLEEFRNLEYGRTYTLSWYEGTKYYENKRVADSLSYVVAFDYDDKGHLFSIEGELTKKGYVEFDISELSPGPYQFNGALVQVN